MGCGWYEVALTLPPAYHETCSQKFWLVGSLYSTSYSSHQFASSYCCERVGQLVDVEGQWLDLEEVRDLADHQDTMVGLGHRKAKKHHVVARPRFWKRSEAIPAWRFVNLKVRALEHKMTSRFADTDHSSPEDLMQG